MIFLVAPAAAAMLALSTIANDRVAAPAVHTRKHHRRHHIAHLRTNSRPSFDPMDRTNDAPRRRRVARMTRLALLQRREALLHDFLIQANTESPAFRDDMLHETGIGLRIGPAVVTQDFVGSPIIRVRVTNSAAASTNALVEVQIANTQGKLTRASIAVSLQPGESRILELLCPQKIDPASLNWTVTAL